MSTWTTIISVILLLVFIMGGVLITNASINLYAFKDTNVNFSNAYYYSTWAAVLTWSLVAFTILGIIGYYVAYYYYQAEVPEAALLNLNQSQESSSGWIILFIIVMFILIIITGILAARTAYEMESVYNPAITQQYRAREEAIITAVLCLGSAGLLLIWLIIDLINYFSPEEKTEEKENKNQLNNLSKEDIIKFKELLK